MAGQQTLAVIDNTGFSHINLTGNATFGRWEPGGTRRYYLTDHLGYNRAVVDAAGNVLETFDYYPFGLLMPKRNTASGNTLEKFSGKELDENTNQYYFGARYYDPALGRFFVTYQFADKYPSMTPYQYAANNPVRFIDVNGDSVWTTIDEESKTYTIHFQGKVLNNSSKDIDLEGAASDIAGDLEGKLSGTVEIDGTEYKVNSSVELTAAESFSDVQESDHVFVIADAFNDDIGGVANRFGGKVAHLNSARFADRNSTFSLGNNIRSAIHETGHLFGLGHTGNIFNVMKQGGAFSFGFNSSQLKDIVTNKNLNRGRNYSIGPLGNKIPNQIVSDGLTISTIRRLGFRYAR